MRIKLVKVFRFKKSFITVMIVAVAVGLTILIVRSLETPATGSVVQSPASKAEVIDSLAKPGKYNGKYVTFIYPAHYQLTPAALSGNYLEVVSYHFVGIATDQITVGVYKGNLDTDGSVDFRKKHPELYKINNSSLGTEFTKVDGSEDTFFLKHDDMLASVSVLGSAGSASANASFVASGLRWR